MFSKVVRMWFSRAPLFSRRQLLAEREKVSALASELEAVRTAHSSLSTAVQQERESAAEGMRLLLLAQNKLSGAAPPAPAVAANGYTNGTAA